MKRYLVFAGDTFYPAGGWYDYAGESDTFDGAMVLIDNMGRPDWWQVVDTEAHAIIDKCDQTWTVKGQR